MQPMERLPGGDDRRGPTQRGDLRSQRIVERARGVDQNLAASQCDHRHARVEPDSAQSPWAFHQSAAMQQAQLRRPVMRPHAARGGSRGEDEERAGEGEREPAKPKRGASRQADTPEHEQTQRKQARAEGPAAPKVDQRGGPEERDDTSHSIQPASSNRLSLTKASTADSTRSSQSRDGGLRRRRLTRWDQRCRGRATLTDCPIHTALNRILPPRREEDGERRPRQLGAKHAAGEAAPSARRAVVTDQGEHL